MNSTSAAFRAADAVAFRSPNLVAMIKRATAFKASPYERSRQNYDTCELSWSAGRYLTLVVTDSIRLTVQSDREATGDGREFRACVSRKQLEEAARYLGAGPVSCLYQKDDAVLKLSSTKKDRLYRLPVEGTFPSWEKILPKSQREGITADCRKGLPSACSCSFRSTSTSRKSER